MSGRLKSINRHIKQLDPELFAASHKAPRIDVYRQSTMKLGPPYLVFSLTEDWTVSTAPVEWGIEPIMARLKAIDLWNNGETVETLNEHNESVRKSKRRDLRNNIESFFGEFRRQFAKATNEINTSLLPKTYLERKKENGSL